MDCTTADQWPLGAGGIPRPQRGGLTATCRRWMHVICVRAHPVGPRFENPSAPVWTFSGLPTFRSPDSRAHRLGP